RSPCRGLGCPHKSSSNRRVGGAWHNPSMLTAEQNDRLTRVGAGTPMGELMRRYWHPVAAVAQMKDKFTKKVRLLGEDLVLYKDLSGTFGLVDNFCPHRRMSMIYGVPEEHGLRCAYHGWLFAESG